MFEAGLAGGEGGEVGLVGGFLCGLGLRVEFARLGEQVAGAVFDVRALAGAEVIGECGYGEEGPC